MIESKMLDVQAPVLECPKNITLPADKDSYHAKVSWNDPYTRGSV